MLSEFQCDICGLKFTTERSEEDALAEYERRFGHLALPPEERAIVCDDCYKVLMILDGLNNH